MARQDEALVAEYFGEEGIAGWKQATGGGKSSGPARSPGRFAGDDRPFSVNGDRAGKGFGGRDLDGDFGESDFDDEFDADFDVEGMDEDDDDFDAGPLGVYGDFDNGEPDGRNVCVFEPREGWVAVMDSSLEGNIELARELSAELKTDTMLVMVNDSDSWYYWLHRNGQSFDEFDSAGGAFDDDAGEPTGEWLKAIEEEDEDKLHELLMAKCAAEHQVPSPEYRPAVSNGGFGGEDRQRRSQLLGAAEVSLAVLQISVQAADGRFSRREDGLRLRHPAHAAG